MPVSLPAVFHVPGSTGCSGHTPIGQTLPEDVHQCDRNHHPTQPVHGHCCLPSALWQCRSPLADLHTNPASLLLCHWLHFVACLTLIVVHMYMYMVLLTSHADSVYTGYYSVTRSHTDCVCSGYYSVKHITHHLCTDVVPCTPLSTYMYMYSQLLQGSIWEEGGV